MAIRETARSEPALVTHTFSGHPEKVIKDYHQDVDMMGWLGYVEVTHTLIGRPRGWKFLLQSPRKELTVTYRRLE